MITLLTEYEWEQKKRERDSFANFLLNSAVLADNERKYFEVEHVSSTMEAWSIIKDKKESEGWTLCDYGQSGSMFMMSGYFKRKKTNQ